MGINTVSIKTKVSAGRILSGTLMIAGTTVGAGMLGIPLVTAPAGFWPAAAATALVWLFMMATGLLFLEVALWMPNETNILSMACRFLGNKGKIVVGLMFAFLYYCLMVAYFAAGAPLVTGFFNTVLGIELQGWTGYVLFGLIFGFVVALGVKSIDRTNIIITAAMAAAFVGLLGIGSGSVETARWSFYNWPGAVVAIPVLFSAFGYHNVIPSLCTYLGQDRRVLTFSILLGTLIPLMMYLLWQWLIIGSIPQEIILEAKALGKPATTALQAVSGSPWIYTIGQYFAFFAIVTSMLGVAFSMVDFLGDGLKVSRNGLMRVFFDHFDLLASVSLCGSGSVHF